LLLLPYYLQEIFVYSNLKTGGIWKIPLIESIAYKIDFDAKKEVTPIIWV